MLLLIENSLFKKNIVTINKIVVNAQSFENNKDIIKIINNFKKNTDLLVLVRNKIKLFNKKEELALSYFKKRSKSMLMEISYNKDTKSINSHLTDIVIKGFEDNTWYAIKKIINHLRKQNEKNF